MRTTFPSFALGMPRCRTWIRPCRRTARSVLIGNQGRTAYGLLQWVQGLR